jgi:hypothetical protein
MYSMRMAASAVAALALLMSVAAVRAGDPIQVGTDKTKPTPAENRPVDADVFKSWNKSKFSTPQVNPLTPFIVPGRSLDQRDEKRLKNERDERKNWMLLEPGELQQRDEEEEQEFGGKAVRIDDFNEDERGNYLFHNVGQQRSDKPRNIAPRTAGESDEQPKRDTRSSLSVLGTREADRPGAHTVNELNLKGLIDPAQVSAEKFNKNEASLFQFFKDNSPTQADRDQQARRDSFRQFISGPQPGTPSGGSDPINFRTDLTQERMNPIMPSRGFDLPAPTKAPDSFSTASGFTPVRMPGLPDAATLAPRQPMAGSYLPSPLLTPNEAAKTPRAGVMGGGSMFNRDGPRRSGL